VLRIVGCDSQGCKNAVTQEHKNVFQKPKMYPFNHLKHEQRQEAKGSGRGVTTLYICQGNEFLKVLFPCLSKHSSPTLQNHPFFSVKRKVAVCSENHKKEIRYVNTMHSFKYCSV
jgi:hypothetical protein